MNITLQDQIKCVGRELGMRRGVYPKWIDQGRMSREKASQEIAALEAVYETLKELEKKQAGGQIDMDLGKTT